MYKYCPRDNFALTKKNVDSVDLFQCTHCHGLWIPKESLLSLASSRGIPAITHPIEQDELPVHFVQGSLTCPADNTIMHFHSIGTVELDLCSACHGVWLDKGELETLPRGQQSHPSTKSSDLAFNALDILAAVPHIHPELVELAGDATSTGVDILGDLLGGIAEALFNG